MLKVLLTLSVTVLTLGSAHAQALTLWTSLQGDDRTWLEREVSAFSAVSGSDVELVDLPADELVERLLTASPAGEGPDLAVAVPHDQLPRLAEAGVLEAFSPSGAPTASTESSRSAFTLGGRLLGLPLYVEGPALIVNRALVPEEPETFETFLEVAREQTTANTLGFLQVQDTDTFYYNYVWIKSLDGYVFGRDAAGNLNPGDIGLANEGAVQAVELMRSFRYEYDLIPPGVDYSTMHERFRGGGVAMIYNGPWAVADYRAAGLNIDVMPIPPRQNGTEFFGFMTVQGVVVNAFSGAKADAALLARWVARSTAQASLAEAGGRIPASRGAADQVADDGIVAGFAKALANAEPIPAIPEMGAVWDPMRTALERILESPTSDAGAILEGAVVEIRGNLGQPQ